MKYCNHRWILSMIGMWLVCTSCNDPVIENQSEETEGRPTIVNPDEGDGNPEESTTQQKFPNYFKEGTQWNVAKFAEGEEIYMVHYSLEGTATVNDQECIQYWESYDNGTKLLAGYVYTEGDKVYCYRTAEDEAPELIYDFGMAEGDSICVGIVCIYFNEKSDPHSYQVCSGTKAIMSCGHKYEVLSMLEYHDSSYSEEPMPHWDENDWVAGIGGIRFKAGAFANWGYGRIGGVGHLETVVCNGETIFDRNDVTETSEQK